MRLQPTTPALDRAHVLAGVYLRVRPSDALYLDWRASQING